MAEVHIVGTIVGASEFPIPNLCCKYEIVAGDSWVLLEGHPSGQTHVDIPLNEKQTIWSHPLDIHYNTKSIAGWPKLLVKVYYQDMFGRNILCAYGFIHIPSSPGIHEVDIHTWQPCGSKSDEVWSRFLGTSIHLADETLVYEAVDRFRLLTKSMGKVQVKFMIVIRNFKKNGVAV